MRLTVNGELRDVPDVGTVSELLTAFKLENKILVVELNREIIDRNSYGDTKLQEGDQVEIVHFVGGG